MESDRHDWVMVQIDEVSRAARKLAVALLDAEDEDELIEVEQATDGLLEDAFEHARISVVDSRTAAMILRPPSRIRGYAQLLAHKSRLLHERGEIESSRQLARRALELQLEAAALEPDPEHVDHAAIDALLDRDPPLALGPRHRQLLAELDRPPK